MSHLFEVGESSSADTFRQTHDLTVEKPKRSRRKLLNRTTAGVVTLVVIGVAVVLGAIFQDNWSSSAVGWRNVNAPTEVWDMLNSKPSAIAPWDPLHQMEFDAESQELTIDSSDIVLADLGSTHTSSPLSIRTYVRQPQLQGDAGVFFGYQVTDEETGRRIDFQTVELYPQNGRFYLRRRVVTFRENEHGLPTIKWRELARARVMADLGAAEYELLVQLNVDETIMVEFEGQRLLESDWHRSAPAPEPRSIVGQFGLLNSRGITVFRRSQWKPM